MDGSKFSKVQRILEDPNRPPSTQEERSIREELLKGRFLIDDVVDELKILKTRYISQRYDTRKLHLMLFVTYRCNFQCPYCFQQQLMHADYQLVDSPRGLEDPSLSRSLIHYIRNATAHGVEHLVIDWFGGEPLLKLRTIMKLSMDFKRICEEHMCQYTAYVTTNGYLLTPNVCDQLRRAGVKGVMVTLDGPPAFHNKRRPLKGGQPTFDTIIRNLRSAVEFFDRVNIRCNVDKENAEALNEFLEILATNGLNRPNVTIVFSPTTIYEAIVPELCEVDAETYTEKTLAALEKALALGFKIARRDKEDLLNCLALTRNFFAITPSGDIYKCPTFAGDPEVRDGFIDRNMETLKLTYSATEWLAWDPFENRRCRSCKMLPICMGGCPYNAIMRRLKRQVHLLPHRTELPGCEERAKRRLELALLYDYEEFKRRRARKQG